MKSGNQLLAMGVLWFGLAVLSDGAAGASQEWVARSDANTEAVTELFARYLPEMAGSFGAEGVDENVTQISHRVDDLANQQEAELIHALKRKLAVEEDARVAQDLEILIQTLERDLEITRLEESLLLPYVDVAETVFQGCRVLLDDQVEAERKQAALVRLGRYAGLEKGYTPLTDQAMRYSRERFDRPELLGPPRDEVVKDLARMPRLISGIAQLFESQGMDGWQEAHEALASQLESYGGFIESEILPRARDDFRLPPELYRAHLAERGVDMPVEELISRAKVAFKEIQNEMQAIAQRIALDQELTSHNYRDVLQELKKAQLTEERILEHYTARIEAVEAIIQNEGVATLPQRPMRLRLATEGEEAVVQAATIRWPQLLGEAAEVGEIILPVRRVSTSDADDSRLDDFTFEAASWNLVVHEGRPGHELQMASMLERGVSKARAFYALNSTNVEGWALYVESEMKPYLPLDGQLVSLQHRLLRAARAFLDPELQLGRITPQAALDLLTRDVVISKALAEQEVERYTTRMPGQATSYFCGYSRYLELRVEAEMLLGEQFDRRTFNDLVLSQGLLPPSLMKRYVLKELAR